MHNPKIQKNPACKHSTVYQYWHDYKGCKLDECGVNECANCGMYATECAEETRWQFEDRMYLRRETLKSAWYFWFCCTVAWFAYTFVWFAANQTPPHDFNTFLQIWGGLVACYIAHSLIVIYNTRRKK